MECKNSSLCIFDKPGVLTDIQRSYVANYFPVNTLSSTGPLEFQIPGTREDYIDLSSTALYVRFKIVREDGKPLDQSTDIVAFNNLGIASLFSDASLTIGEQQIQGGSSDYTFRAYFGTVMQFTPAAQDSSMRAMGWYKDEADKFDDKTNKGFAKRQALVGNSNSVELYGPLYFDFFNQDRHLINLTPMRIKLVPNKPEFFLNSYAATPPKMKIVFEEVNLYIEHLEMNPSVINGHEVGLTTQNAQYFINHTELLSFTVPKGQLSYIKENLFTDSAPKMVMIAMVDNTAYNGDITKNPFHFKHYDLSRLTLLHNGRPFPCLPLTPDFANKRYLRSYVQSMKALGYFNTDDTNGLKPEEFAGGYTIFVFDLTPDKEASSGCLHANVPNNLRLELNFAKKLPNTINVLAYAVSDSRIEVTKLRDVITHFNR